MESERKSKGIIIGVLCAVIVFMSIGFAALSSQLTIRGNATISDTWNVQITNIEKKEAFWAPGYKLFNIYDTKFTIFSFI